MSLKDEGLNRLVKIEFYQIQQFCKTCRDRIFLFTGGLLSYPSFSIIS